LFYSVAAISWTSFILFPAKEAFYFFSFSSTETGEFGELITPFAFGKFLLVTGGFVEDGFIREVFWSWATDDGFDEPRLSDVLHTFESDDVIKLTSRVLCPANQGADGLATEGSVKRSVCCTSIVNEPCVDARHSVPNQTFEPICDRVDPSKKTQALHCIVGVGLAWVETKLI
jgi:hypothetical protein